jgi:hypothetical protein
MSAPSGRTGTREREEVWAECAEFHEEPTRELRDPPEDRGGFRPPRWARLQNVLFWSLVPVALGALAILVALVTGHLVDDPRISTSSPSFSIRIAPNRQKVSQGSNASYAISLQARPVSRMRSFYRSAAQRGASPTTTSVHLRPQSSR